MDLKNTYGHLLTLKLSRYIDQLQPKEIAVKELITGYLESVDIDEETLPSDVHFNLYRRVLEHLKKLQEINVLTLKRSINDNDVVYYLIQKAA